MDNNNNNNNDNSNNNNSNLFVPNVEDIYDLKTLNKDLRDFKHVSSNLSKDIHSINVFKKSQENPFTFIIQNKTGIRINCVGEYGSNASFLTNFFLYPGYKWYYEIKIISGIDKIQIGFCVDNINNLSENDKKTIDNSIYCWTFNPYYKILKHNKKSNILNTFNVPLPYLHLYENKYGRISDIISIVFDFISITNCSIQIYLNGKIMKPTNKIEFSMNNINIQQLGAKYILPFIKLYGCPNSEIILIFDSLYMKYPLSKDKGYKCVAQSNLFVENE